MAKFHTLTVADITRETADAVSIAFDIPSSLKDEYKYIPGQYVTLKINHKGEELRRSYSICSNPYSNEPLRIAIKKVTEGRGSSFLNDSLKKGDKVEVMTPMGNFNTPISASNSKTYILFAGGSGITPMMSIAKAVLQEEAKSNVILFYANRDEASTIFNAELKTIEANSNNRLKVVHIQENPANATVADIYKGLLTDAKIKGLFEKHGGLQGDCEYFICGPTPMMQLVETTLKEGLKLAKDRVHLEYFTAALDAAKAPKAESTGDSIMSQVTIIMDGEETIISLASDGEAILDAALNADMDVPFACKGAVCCTCRAKLIEGQVKMDLNYALSEGEVKAGYILTCQSHPITPTVIVDYDAA
jgi:ring-1,2-phenylacetyl-CoA epoxidase subunit PaaE